MPTDAHTASCTLRQLARGYRHTLDLIARAIGAAAALDLDDAVIEARKVVDALELGAAALETVHTFIPDTDGPPLCPFCHMPYNPSPTGLVS